MIRSQGNQRSSERSRGLVSEHDVSARNTGPRPHTEAPPKQVNFSSNINFLGEALQTASLPPPDLAPNKETFPQTKVQENLSDIIEETNNDIMAFLNDMYTQEEEYHSDIEELFDDCFTPDKHCRKETVCTNETKRKCCCSCHQNLQLNEYKTDKCKVKNIKVPSGTNITIPIYAASSMPQNQNASPKLVWPPSESLFNRNIPIHHSNHIYSKPHPRSYQSHYQPCNINNSPIYSPSCHNQPHQNNHSSCCEAHDNHSPYYQPQIDNHSPCYQSHVNNASRDKRLSRHKPDFHMSSPYSNNPEMYNFTNQSNADGDLIYDEANNYSDTLNFDTEFDINDDSEREDHIDQIFDTNRQGKVGSPMNWDDIFKFLE